MEKIANYFDYLPDHEQSLEEVAVDAFSAILPPENITVAECAEKHIYINNPGSYVGQWKNEFAPYLIQPQEVLTSGEHTSMVIVGPARAGKTQLLFNWLAHTTLYDPSNILLIHMTMAFARDWSVGDFEKFLRDNPEIGEMYNPISTVNDIWFKNGARLSIKHPAISELSGKTVPRGWLADYDRMPQDIGKEGSPFYLLNKRGETFRRNAMFVAESSPGFEVNDTKWVNSVDEPHEGPPCDGIVSLYNQGDRRRWYWSCPHCSIAFMPDFAHLRYPRSSDYIDAASQAHMECPSCKGTIGSELKQEMNIGGTWLKEGQYLDKEGKIHGRGRVSNTASFWIPGVAAAFAPWSKLVLNYLNAMDALEKTGSDSALKNTINLDQGKAYVPRGLGVQKDPHAFKKCAERLGDRVVPPDVRFLIATVDTQRNRFEVQVHGFTAPNGGSGLGDIIVIDRFNLRKSNRLDDDGERFPLSPPSFAEDWHVLIKEVTLKKYPLAEKKGYSMSILGVGVDAYGMQGTTTNAYNFWRFLSRRPTNEDIVEETGWVSGLDEVLTLTKGEHSRSAPRVQIRYPDSAVGARVASIRGEIPVMFFNTTTLKDTVMGMVDHTLELGKGSDSDEVGKGRVRVPDWLPDYWYKELFAEVRTEKRWENKNGARNEAFDLLYMALGYALSSKVRIDTMDWETPEPWADVQDFNSLVTADGEGGAHPMHDDDATSSLEDLGRLLS